MSHCQKRQQPFKVPRFEKSLFPFCNLNMKYLEEGQQGKTHCIINYSTGCTAEFNFLVGVNFTSTNNQLTVGNT